MILDLFILLVASLDPLLYLHLLFVGTRLKWNENSFVSQVVGIFHQLEFLSLFSRNNNEVHKSRNLYKLHALFKPVTLLRGYPQVFSRNKSCQLSQINTRSSFGLLFNHFIEAIFIKIHNFDSV